VGSGDEEGRDENSDRSFDVHGALQF